METAKIFTRIIETKSPLGDFYVKVELEQPADEMGNTVLVSSYQDLKDADPVIATMCGDDLDEILKNVQEVSHGHTQHLMEKEREDITKFFTNRGFKPEYPKFRI